jgi:hypothetical protein
LEENEQKEGRRHMESGESCRQELAKAAQVARAFPAHPAPEILVRLAAGEESGLGREQQKEVASHVARCSRCRESMALLGESNAALASSEEGGQVHAFPSRRTLRRWQGLAVAASLLAVLGLAGWLQELRDSPAAGQAQNVALLELGMGTDRGSIRELEFVAGAASYRLELGGLLSGDIAPGDSVRVLSGGELLREVSGLNFDPLSEVYSFQISRVVPQGLLTVQILASDGTIKKEKRFLLKPYATEAEGADLG